MEKMFLTSSTQQSALCLKTCDHLSLAECLYTMSIMPTTDSGYLCCYSKNYVIMDLYSCIFG